jgi:hypothetical protein
VLRERSLKSDGQRYEATFDRCKDCRRARIKAPPPA